MARDRTGIDYTCPDIDEVIRSMEKLRRSNDGLRGLATEAMDERDELQGQVKDLEKENAKLEARIADLEQELDDALAQVP